VLSTFFSKKFKFISGSFAVDSRPGSYVRSGDFYRNKTAESV
jgi:hypothetical protein